MKPHELWRGAKGLSKYHLGVGVADEEEINKRKEICKNCELIKNKTDDLKGSKCSACGCLIRAKTALKNEKCPKGKWSFHIYT